MSFDLKKLNSDFIKNFQLFINLEKGKIINSLTEIFTSDELDFTNYCLEFTSKQYGYYCVYNIDLCIPILGYTDKLISFCEDNNIAVYKLIDIMSIKIFQKGDFK